jgi:putative ABC transport system permease protein
LLRTRIEQMLSDLRYGARILTRSPGFSAAAVLLIAMGIGGNTAIYSMIHGILSKPAPGVRSGGLVVFGASINGRADDPGNNSYPSHLAYAYRTRTMQSFAAAKFARFTLGLADGTWQLRGFQVTGSYIGTLGLQLSKGRDFTENEARGAAPLAAIIAWHVWQNQFHGDSTVIGSAITLDGWPATVVGVGPPGFRGLEVAPHFEICVPLEAYFRLAGREEELRNPASRGFTMVGRLKPAATLAQAQAEFDALSKLLEAAFPDANRGRRVLLAAYPSAAFGPLGGPQSRLFETLLLVAGLVTLSIVCANVANLMLTRALARRKEMAVRMALGASWTRVVRILLAEGATLSLAASGAALLLAWWVTSIVGSLMPPIESGARFTMDLTPDWPVALYALALAAFCTLVFSIAPAVHLWRQDLAPRLKGSGEAAARGLSVSSALLVAQLALCAVLAAAGGFAWRALAAIDNTDVLIARDHLLLAAINTTPAGQPATALNSIRGRLLALPEVTSVSWALAAPPDSHSWKGVPATAVGSGRSVRTQGSRVGPDYLHALGVRLLAGRDLSGADLRSPRPMAVINQKLADALWPGQPAVGRTFSMRLGDRPVEVVGVAPNAPFSGVGDDGSYAGMGRAERPNFVFLPDSTEGVGQKTLHIRYRGDGGHLAQSVRAAIHQVDPGLPVFSMRTMEQEWASFTGPMRFISILVRIFALAALLLASVGLYAVVSFRTARRTHEFGIRAALGASPRQAIGEALRGGLRLSFIGLAIGLAIAGVAGRALRSLLFGVAPMDAAVLLTVVGLLGGVSWVACYLPARRAGRVDPAIALRHE